MRTTTRDRAVRLHVSLERAVLDALTKYAAEDGRTVSSVVNRLLAEALGLRKRR